MYPLCMSDVKSIIILSKWQDATFVFFSKERIKKKKKKSKANETYEAEKKNMILTD